MYIDSKDDRGLASKHDSSASRDGAFPAQVKAKVSVHYKLSCISAPTKSGQLPTRRRWCLLCAFWLYGNCTGGQRSALLWWMRSSPRSTHMQAAQACSDWSTAPVEVLRCAFELQHNPLDNCAAACTSSAWRKVVNSTSIAALHLYASSESSDDVWTAFLKSRRAIESLRMTRSAIWHENDSHQNPVFINGPRHSMLPAGTTCKKLYLSEHLARHIDHSLRTLPNLQSLSLEWNGMLTMQPMLNQEQEMNRLYSPMLPFFTGITGLTELTINMRNDMHGEMLSFLLIRLPASIQSLSLDGFGSQTDEEQPPAYSAKLGSSDELSHLTALTHLAMTNSSLSIPEDNIICLSQLQSLDLSHSEVYVDGQLDVFQLTQLTHLDLTSTNCFWEDAWVEALDAFVAWPNLKVLKLQACNIVDAETVLTAPGVDELEVLFPLGSQMRTEDVAGKKVAAHFSLPQSTDAGQILASPLYTKPVESLHIHRYLSRVQQVPGPDFWPLLEHYSSLQALHIQNDIVLAKAPAVGQLLKDSGVTHLKKLELVGVNCADLKLEVLTELTHLSLSRVDHQTPVLCLLMPESLQELEYEGSSLFGKQVCDSGDTVQLLHNLHALTSLTRLVLCPIRFPYLSTYWQPSLPSLPHNLRSLEVLRWYFDSTVDWSALKLCEHLEHLRLPGGYKRPAELNSYLSAARQLHVVDEDTAGANLGAWWNEADRTWHGTRILVLDE